MTIFLVIVILLCLCKMKLSKPILTGINEKYLDIGTTDSVKGIFVLLVFLSHARNCISMLPGYQADSLNKIYDVFQNHMGQGIVVMFLFYSGYGVMESIKKKGGDYVNAFPKQRFGKTLFNFDVAVLLFIITDLCLGTLGSYSVPQVLLSFTGWEFVGNDNWYIFAVLIMYLITYAAFKAFKNNFRRAAAAVTVLTVVYIAAMYLLKGTQSWWYDTVILYPLGIWYSIGREAAERFVKKRPINYYLVLGVCAAVFIASHLLRDNIACYEISQISLCAVIVALTIKIDIGNKLLRFFGAHLFEIYILMRIPMLVLLHFDITNTYLFTAVSFAVTVALAVVFKKLLAFLDSKIFTAKLKK